MPLDLTEETVTLSCVDDTITIQKDKLKIFNYFNKIFEDEPDIKEIKLNEKKDELESVLTYISKNTYKKKDITSISYYFFKWDAIVSDTELEFCSLVVDYADELCLDSKDFFDYFCKWVAYYVCCRGGQLEVHEVEEYPDKFQQMIQRVCLLKDDHYGSYFAIQKGHIPEKFKDIFEDD